MKFNNINSKIETWENLIKQWLGWKVFYWLIQNQICLSSVSLFYQKMHLAIGTLHCKIPDIYFYAYLFILMYSCHTMFQLIQGAQHSDCWEDMMM